MDSEEQTRDGARQAAHRSGDGRVFRRSEQVEAGGWARRGDACARQCFVAGGQRADHECGRQGRTALCDAHRRAMALRSGVMRRSAVIGRHRHRRMIGHCRHRHSRPVVVHLRSRRRSAMRTAGTGHCARVAVERQRDDQQPQGEGRQRFHRGSIAGRDAADKLEAGPDLRAQTPRCGQPMTWSLTTPTACRYA